MLPDKLPGVGTTIFAHMSALAAEHGALNLAQGFPDFPPPAELLESMARQVHAGHNQYAPLEGVAELRQQISLQLSRHRQLSVDPQREITVVPGATEGLFCAIMACVDRGDEAIVLDPCYDSYAPAIALAGGRAVHVPLCDEDFSVDWQRVNDAVSARTRLLIINSPHNPSGAVLSRDDMKTLESLAERHDLLVISDEVYEHLLYDGREHHSVLQYPALRARSVAVFSFGKTFSVTGWKTGYCVAPPQLTAGLRKIHQFVSFVAVTPVQYALADFMAQQPDYPALLHREYQRKRDLFCAALAGSRLGCKPSAGTYFQLLDYSALSRATDTGVAEQWTRQHKLAAIPVSVFYRQPPGQHLLRFCFAKSDDVLLAAAKILCEIQTSPSFTAS